MPRGARDIASNLQRKGFVPDEGNHTFYRLFVDGKNTGIRTKISHGREGNSRRIARADGPPREEGVS